MTGLQVIGYDYYYDDADQTSVIVTLWNTGERTIQKEHTIFETDNRGFMWERAGRVETLYRLPSSARFLNSYRKGD